MSRLRAQDGFTLVELLVSCIIGTIVLLGAFTILDTSGRSQARISDRSESIARGRSAIEQLVQQLRSQVCIGSGNPAIVYGDGNHVTFYGDFKDNYTDSSTKWGTNIFVPAERDLVYANGKVTESVYPGSIATGNGNNAPAMPYTFATTPASVRVVADKLALRTVNGAAVPFFKYYAFDSSDPIRPSRLLSTPLADTDRDNVVQITINFKALPTRYASTYPGEPFTADVFARTADPTDPTHSPLCF